LRKECVMDVKMINFINWLFLNCFVLNMPVFRRFLLFTFIFEVFGHFEESICTVIHIVLMSECSLSVKWSLNHKGIDSTQELSGYYH
jgi:hypothetical protein